MQYAGIIIIAIIIVCFYVVFNLLKKLEKVEEAYDKAVDDLEKSNQYFAQLTKLVDISDKKLKEIDDRGVFIVDDEIGWFFDHVKQIQDVLNSAVKK